MDLNLRAENNDVEKQTTAGSTPVRKKPCARAGMSRARSDCAHRDTGVVRGIPCQPEKAIPRRAAPNYFATERVPG